MSIPLLPIQRMLRIKDWHCLLPNKDHLSPDNAHDKGLDQHWSRLSQSKGGFSTDGSHMTPTETHGVGDSLEVL